VLDSLLDAISGRPVTYLAVAEIVLTSEQQTPAAFRPTMTEAAAGELDRAGVRVEVGVDADLS
jgi:hypothetical protein